MLSLFTIVFRRALPLMGLMKHSLQLLRTFRIIKIWCWRKLLLITLQWLATMSPRACVSKFSCASRFIQVLLFWFHVRSVSLFYVGLRIFGNLCRVPDKTNWKTGFFCSLKSLNLAYKLARGARVVPKLRFFILYKLSLTSFLSRDKATLSSWGVSCSVLNVLLMRDRRCHALCDNKQQGTVHTHFVCYSHFCCPSGTRKHVRDIQRLSRWHIESANCDRKHGYRWVFKSRRSSVLDGRSKLQFLCCTLFSQTHFRNFLFPLHVS